MGTPSMATLIQDMSSTITFVEEDLKSMVDSMCVAAERRVEGILGTPTPALWSRRDARGLLRRAGAGWQRQGPVEVDDGAATQLRVVTPSERN